VEPSGAGPGERRPKVAFLPGGPIQLSFSRANGVGGARLTEVAQSAEIAIEQQHYDRALVEVEKLRRLAQNRLDEALSVRGGTPQATTERDMVVAESLARLSGLNFGDQAMVFGRMDFSEIQEGLPERVRLGRLSLLSDEMVPLILDWRAPVAEPFYRATPLSPMGLRARAHVGIRHNRVESVTDEPLGEAGADAAERLSPALFAALERPRTGHMSDIVATIQADQDRAIRHPLPGVLVVEGGPGTGKTAVALHRAAYLIYSHRFPLERQGLAVVCPNRAFRHYVSRVLPSLGENGVVVTTVAGLIRPGIVPAEEDPEVALLKGSAVMAAVVAKAVRDRQRALPGDLVVDLGSYRLEVDRQRQRQIVRLGRSRRGPHNSVRRWVERALIDQLMAQLDEAERRLLGRPRANRDDQEVRRQLRRHPAVVAALERMWPVLSPEELLHDLFGSRALLRLAGAGTVAEKDIDRLYRPRQNDVDQVAWTRSDLALLDEAASLLEPEDSARAQEAGHARAGPQTEGAPPTYLASFGHLVVDEAQDLTPMEVRVLGRRCPTGSATFVGDLAQATGRRHGLAGWQELVAEFSAARDRHPWVSGSRSRPPEAAFAKRRLSVSYRTPQEVMQVAGRLLVEIPEAGEPPEVVRSSGEASVLIRASRPELAAAVCRLVLGWESQMSAGTIAVITHARLIGELAEALADTGADIGTGETELDQHRINVLTVETAKGLEYDAVAVVAPEAILGDPAGETAGRRALYVALTRATSRLAILTCGETPKPLLGAVTDGSLRPQCAQT
jgi:DNA helicase IV